MTTCIPYMSGDTMSPPERRPTPQQTLPLAIHGEWGAGTAYAVTEGVRSVTQHP